MSLDYEKKIVSGWGRTNFVNVNSFKPKNLIEIQEFIKARKNHSIPRGLGRSYGDSAQCGGGYIIDASNFNSFSLDKANSTLTSAAGSVFSDILNYIIPKGFFLPVSPGTKNVTVGGAISADVHGKNHHCDGSFANHVESILLIDGNGILRKLSPKDNSTADAFWATSGGMGLTGIIIEATFKLIPISTSYISVDTQKFDDLESLMDEMKKSDNYTRYSVAWIDSLDKKGRGILTTGNHTNFDDISDNKKFSKMSPLKYSNSDVPNTPSFLPNGILNNFTVGIFNQAWFSKAPRLKKGEIQSINSFFYPLDGVKNWNRIYGPKGFIQYQFVVPDEYQFLISKILNSLRECKAPSFLTVLKRFGNFNNGPLSFPQKGWTLAADIPANNSGLYKKLDEIDQLISKAGGRVYLAKDSRQSSKMFRECYLRLNEWLVQKKLLDPHNIFVSDLSKRLKI